MVTNIKFYKVGGYVRDQIMGVKSKDIDYAVEAPSYEAMRDYIAARGKIYQERPQYFTVRAKLNGEDCDYVLCRKEGAYSDGRRPDEVSMGTIRDDLARRDFTCNAIALDEQDNIIDPFLGQLDIQHRLIRCVGKAEDRFKEDSLRLLRALRFCITKNFTLTLDIHHCLDSQVMIDRLANCSVERIREELFKCFSYNTVATFELLQKYDKLFRFIFAGGDLYLVPTLR